LFALFEDLQGDGDRGGDEASNDNEDTKQAENEEQKQEDGVAPIGPQKASIENEPEEEGVSTRPRRTTKENRISSHQHRLANR